MIAFIDQPAALPPRSRLVQTPFGPVHYQQTGRPQGDSIRLFRGPADRDSRALAYAARLLQAQRVVSVIRDTRVHKPTTPSDFIEFTSGRPTTFFVSTGAGYVSQSSPFCPQLRQSLIACGADEARTLLVVETLPVPAACAWWSARQVDLFSVESQPEGALCRELELCHAVLALPSSEAVLPLADRLLAALPATRDCPCAETMAVARKLGKLPPDWFEGLGDRQ